MYHYHQNIYISGSNVVFKTIQKYRAFHVFEQTIIKDSTKELKIPMKTRKSAKCPLLPSIKVYWMEHLTIIDTISPRKAPKASCRSFVSKKEKKRNNLSLWLRKICIDHLYEISSYCAKQLVYILYRYSNNNNNIYLRFLPSCTIFTISVFLFFFLFFFFFITEHWNDFIFDAINKNKFLFYLNCSFQITVTGSNFSRARVFWISAFYIILKSLAKPRAQKSRNLAITCGSAQSRAHWRASPNRCSIKRKVLSND